MQGSCSESTGSDPIIHSLFLVAEQPVVSISSEIIISDRIVTP